MFFYSKGTFLWDKLNTACMESICRVETLCLDWTKTWCSPRLCTHPSTYSNTTFFFLIKGTLSLIIIPHMVVETWNQLVPAWKQCWSFVVVFLVLAYQNTASKQTNETEPHWCCRFKKTSFEFVKTKPKKVNQRLTPCSVRRDKSRSCRQEEHSRLNCSDTYMTIVKSLWDGSVIWAPHTHTGTHTLLSYEVSFIAGNIINMWKHVH